MCERLSTCSTGSSFSGSAPSSCWRDRVESPQRKALRRHSRGIARHGQNLQRIKAVEILERLQLVVAQIDLLQRRVAELWATRTAGGNSCEQSRALRKAQLLQRRRKVLRCELCNRPQAPRTGRPRRPRTGAAGQPMSAGALRVAPRSFRPPFLPRPPPNLPWRSQQAKYSVRAVGDGGRRRLPIGARRPASDEGAPNADICEARSGSKLPHDDGGRAPSQRARSSQHRELSKLCAGLEHINAMESTARSSGHAQRTTHTSHGRGGSRHACGGGTETEREHGGDRAERTARAAPRSWRCDSTCVLLGAAREAGNSGGVAGAGEAVGLSEAGQRRGRYGHRQARRRRRAPSGWW